jgi:hypothetical protein
MLYNFSSFFSMKRPLIGNAQKFWTYTAVFIIGIILCMVLSGWYKSIGIFFVALYVIYRFCLLNDDIKTTEENIRRKYKE